MKQHIIGRIYKHRIWDDRCGCGLAEILVANDDDQYNLGYDVVVTIVMAVLPEAPEVPACATHIELLVDTERLGNMYIKALYLDWHILDRREETEK